MSTLIVKTENKAAAKLLLAFLKTVRLVKSIALAPEEGSPIGVNEPASSALRAPSPKEKGSGNNLFEAYNWTNPSRPATDEEIDAMLDACEKSPSFTTEEVKNFVNEELREWRKSRK
jgi:hypothetical protein